MQQQARQCGVWAILGLGLCLALPSTSTFAKYTLELRGARWVPWVVLAYLAGALAGVVIVVRLVAPWAARRLSRGATRGLEIAMIAILITVFAVLYPLAKSRGPQRGSDRDDALDKAVTALVRGVPRPAGAGNGTTHFPYYQLTRLNGPISPLPGAVLLAVPFVLLGTSAYQNLFWMLAFYIVLKVRVRDARIGLVAMVSTLCLSPTVMRDFVTGSDLLCNGIYVLLFTLLLVRAAAPGGLAAYGSAALLGLGLSSRANFLALVPLIFSALGQTYGWKPAVRLMCVAGAAFLAVTLPFYLYDPSHFSPLHTADKLRQLDEVWPHASLTIPAVGGLLACGLACFRMRGADSTFLWSCCAVLAALVAPGVVVLALRMPRWTDFTYASFGIAFVFFGVLAAWLQMADRLRPTERPGVAT